MNTKSEQPNYTTQRKTPYYYKRNPHILYQHFIHGYSVDELASLTGFPSRTVKHLLRISYPKVGSYKLKALK